MSDEIELVTKMIAWSEGRAVPCATRRSVAVREDAWVLSTIALAGHDHTVQAVALGPVGGVPFVRGLVQVRVPRVMSVLIVMVVVTALLVGGTALLADVVTRFTEKAPEYQRPLERTVADFLQWLDARHIPRPPEITELLNTDDVVNLVTQTLSAVVTVLSRLIIIILTTAFILLESVQIGDKLKAAFAGQGGVSTSLFEGANTIQRYLAIKTTASLITGVLVGVWNLSIGLDFAILWGILAFALNFIPSIGSIVAAIPAVALALVQLGPGWAIATTIVYLAVNFSIGNVLEPRILGRRLGLSPLVVILSLFFWGWVWGPAGMLLSVPMTVVIKLLLELSDDTRWLAILLGPAAEVTERTEEIRERSSGLVEAVEIPLLPPDEGSA